MDIETLKTRNDLTADEIKLLMDAETNPKIYNKLQFLRLVSLNYSTYKAYRLCGIKKSTALDILDKWENGGYYSLIHKKGAGRKFKLIDDEIKELKTILDQNNIKSYIEVQKLVKDKWGVNYTILGIKVLLKNQFGIVLEDNAEN